MTSSWLSLGIFCTPCTTVGRKTYHSLSCMNELLYLWAGIPRYAKQYTLYNEQMHIYMHLYRHSHIWTSYVILFRIICHITSCIFRKIICLVTVLLSRNKNRFSIHWVRLTKTSNVRWNWTVAPYALVRLILCRERLRQIIIDAKVIIVVSVDISWPDAVHQ